MPQEMLKKKQLEINLTKDKVKEEKKELSYLSAMKYDEMKAQSARFGTVFDKSRDYSSPAVTEAPVFKAKNEFKLKRSENIEKGKQLTPDATAFTLEIHDQIQSADDLLKKDYLAVNGVTLLGLVGHLKSVHFSPNMLLPSMIRANFMNYYTLAREWESYSSLEKTDGEALPKALEELYRIFYRRMSLYCRENRINLDGTPMNEGETIKESEIISQYEAEIFSDLSKEYDKVKSKKDVEDPEKEPIHFEKDELQKAEKQPTKEDKPREDPYVFITSLREMKPKERALLSPSMKQLDKELKDQIKNSKDPKEKAILQKSEQLLSSWITYTELQIALSKDPENKPLWKRQNDYLNDLRLLENRFLAPNESELVLKNPSSADEA